MHECDYDDTKLELTINKEETTEEAVTKAFSISESESHSAEEDSEEVVKSIFLSEASESQGTKAKEAPAEAHSLLTKIESSHLSLGQAKEAQRSINGAALGQSATASSVSSSASISSSGGDEEPPHTGVHAHGSEPVSEAFLADAEIKSDMTLGNKRSAVGLKRLLASFSFYC